MYSYILEKIIFLRYFTQRNILYSIIVNKFIIVKITGKLFSLLSKCIFDFRELLKKKKHGIRNKLICEIFLLKLCYYLHISLKIMFPNNFAAIFEKQF